MEEVSALNAYLNEHPTTAEILTLVHEVKTNKTRLHLSDTIDEHAFEQEFSQMPEYLGRPEQAPDDFLQNVKWAAEQMKKLKSN